MNASLLAWMVISTSPMCWSATPETITPATPSTSKPEPFYPQIQFFSMLFPVSNTQITLLGTKPQNWNCNFLLLLFLTPNCSLFMKQKLILSLIFKYSTVFYFIYFFKPMRWWTDIPVSTNPRAHTPIILPSEARLSSWSVFHTGCKYEIVRWEMLL